MPTGYTTSAPGTFGWVTDRAREILADKDGERLRWREAELLRFVDAGIVELRARRPAAQYVGLFRVSEHHVVAPHDDETGIEVARSAPLMVNSRWHEALAHYVAYRALLMDESDSSNQNLAQQHLQQFDRLCLT